MLRHTTVLSTYANSSNQVFLLPGGSQHLEGGWETRNLGVTDTRLPSAAALCAELGDKQQKVYALHRRFLVWG